MLSDDRKRKQYIRGRHRGHHQARLERRLFLPVSKSLTNKHYISDNVRILSIYAQYLLVHM